MTTDNTTALLGTLTDLRKERDEWKARCTTLAQRINHLSQMASVIPQAVEFATIDLRWKEAKKRYAAVKYEHLSAKRQAAHADGRRALKDHEWDEYRAEVEATDAFSVYKSLRGERTTSLADLRRAAVKAGLL
jgi:hypothetical protein